MLGGELPEFESCIAGVNEWAERTRAVSESYAASNGGKLREPALDVQAAAAELEQRKRIFTAVLRRRRRMLETLSRALAAGDSPVYSPAVSIQKELNR